MSRTSRRRSARPARRETPVHTPLAARLRPAYAAAALAAAHLAAVLLLLEPTPYDGGDNAAYLALARSLLADGSYRELWDPAARTHAQYPPGWPLVVAGALAAGVKPWMGLKALTALFSAAGVALSYLWARRHSTPGVALGTGLLLALAPGVIDLGRLELSDPPFWAFCMLALWGFSRLAGPGEPPKQRMGAIAIAAAGVLLAYMTRSAGLPLVAAAGLWLAWNRRWRALGALGAVVAPFAIAWGVRARRVGGGGYGEHLLYVDPYRPELGTAGPGELARRLRDNVADYTADHLPYLLTGVRDGWPVLLLGVAVAALAAAGWARRVRRRETGLAEWWLPLYLGLVLVWPAEWSGERFVLPVLPLLLVLAGEALAAGAARGPAPARAAGIVVVGALLLQAMPRLASAGARVAACRAEARAGDPYPCMRPPMADYLRLARWARRALPPGSAVIARKPTLWWSESGHPSRVYPFTADPAALLATARDAGARYLVIDHVDNVATIHLTPAIAQRPQAFCVMRSLGPERATLMGIVPGADTLPNLRDRPGDEMLEIGFSWCGEDYWAPGAVRRR